MAGRDIVVIGASMGGVEALRELLHQLPRDFAASVLVVQHTSPHRASALASVLNRSSVLPVSDATDGEQFRAGHVYLAPANRHLLMQGDHLRVGHGPRENRSRPAIDPLFRSAARYGRQRVIGVVLTGLLDDGANGLRAIKRSGGAALVQDPASAMHPGMPGNALAATPVDAVLPLNQMGSWLVRQTQLEAPTPPELPDEIAKEVGLTERAMSLIDHTADMQQTETIGELVPIACPECGGSLWEISVDDRYRCHVGHAYTRKSLRQEQDEKLEESLWAAVRALEERQKTFLTLREQETRRGNSSLHDRYTENAHESARHATRVREVLMRLTTAGEDQ